MGGAGSWGKVGKEAGGWRLEAGGWRLLREEKGVRVKGCLRIHSIDRHTHTHAYTHTHTHRLNNRQKHT